MTVEGEIVKFVEQRCQHQDDCLDLSTPSLRRSTEGFVVGVRCIVNRTS